MALEEVVFDIKNLEETSELWTVELKSYLCKFFPQIGLSLFYAFFYFSIIIVTI